MRLLSRPRRDGRRVGSRPDTRRIVAEDVRGDKLGPLLRAGRVDKGMPAFTLSAADLGAIVAFVHDQKTKAESLTGGRRTVDVADLQTGDPEAGRKYFAGACAKCHSPPGSRRRRQALAGSRAAAAHALSRSGPRRIEGDGHGDAPSGEVVTGRLAYRDEFTIALTDTDGWYRSWPAGR